MKTYSFDSITEIADDEEFDIEEEQSAPIDIAEGEDFKFPKKKDPSAMTNEEFAASVLEFAEPEPIKELPTMANPDETRRQVSSGIKSLSKDDRFIRENFDDELADRTMVLNFYQSQAGKEIDDATFQTLYKNDFGDEPMGKALETLRADYGIKRVGSNKDGWRKVTDEVGLDQGIGWKGIPEKVWKKNFMEQTFGKDAMFRSEADADTAKSFVDRFKKIEGDDATVKLGMRDGLPLPTTLTGRMGKPDDGLEAMRQAQARSNVESNKIKFYEDLNKLPLDVRRNVEVALDTNRLNDLNDYLTTFTKLSSMSSIDTEIYQQDQLRNKLNRHDEGFSKLEKKILNGEANNLVERARVGALWVHENQKIMTTAIGGGRAEAMVMIQRMNELEAKAAETMPGGEGFFQKMVYGTAGSIVPMVESIGASALLKSQAASTAYWTLEGGGAILKDYVTMNNIDLRTVSDEEFNKIKAIAMAGGAVYGAIEHIGGAYGAQGKGLSGVLYSKFIKEAITKKPIWNAFLRGGSKFLMEWISESAEEGGQELVKKIARESIEGDITGGNFKLFLDTSVEALPATFGLTGLMGGAKAFHSKALKVDPQIVKNIARDITGGDVKKAEVIFSKWKAAETPEQRREVESQAKVDNLDTLVQTAMNKRADAKRGFRNGSDGKPLLKSDWNGIFGKDGKARTEEEVRDSFPDDFEHTDLFIAGAKGDRAAQKEYSNLVIGRGTTPSIKSQFAPAMSISEVLPTTEVDENDEVYQSAMEASEEELVKHVAFYKETGIDLPEPVRHALKTRDIKLESLVISVQNAVGQSRYAKEEALVRQVVEQSVNKNAQTATELATDRANTRLSQARETLDAMFDTSPLSEASKFSGLNIKELFEQAAREENVHVITDAMKAVGIDIKDTALYQKLIDTQYQFQLAKRERNKSDSAFKVTKKDPIIKKMKVAFGVTDEQAESLYHLANAMRLPLDKMTFERTTEGEFLARPEVMAESTAPVVPENTSKFFEENPIVDTSDEGVFSEENLSELTANADALIWQDDSLQLGVLTPEIINERLAKVESGEMSDMWTRDRLEAMMARQQQLLTPLASANEQLFAAYDRFQSDLRQGNDVTESKKAYVDAQQNVISTVERTMLSLSADQESQDGPLFQGADGRIRGYRIESRKDGKDGVEKWYAVDRNGNPASFAYPSWDAITKNFYPDMHGLYQTASLYSPLLRAVEGIKQETFTTEQFKGQVGNLAGVKQEELDDLGLFDWLDGIDGKVSKQSIVDFIKKGGPQIEEITKGEGESADAVTTLIQNGYEIAFDEDENAYVGYDQNGDVVYTEHGDLITAETELELAEMLVEELEIQNTALHSDPTKFGQYQLPGGENYREVLLTLPSTVVTKERWWKIGNMDRATAENLYRNGIAEGRVRVVESDRPGTVWIEELGVEELSEGYELLEETRRPNDITMPDFTGFFVKVGDQEVGSNDTLVPLGKGKGFFNEEDARRSARRVIKPDYKSSHWDEANVLAHFRLNDRTGPNGEKILFIEEIQSDWHQAGRKAGYGDTEYDKLEKQRLEIAIKGDNLFAEYPDVLKRPKDVQKQLDDYFAEERRIKELMKEIGYPDAPGVLDAPFKKSWAGLSFKTILRDAVAQGYDSVAWTPGDVQADRYDLSKQVDYISSENFEQDQKIVELDIIGNSSPISLVIDSEGKVIDSSSAQFSGETIDNIVGKEIADKIMQSDALELKGDDLKVGGNGMKGFYDKILPAEVSKIVKKMGGKVGTVEVGVGPESNMRDFEEWAESRGINTVTLSVSQEAKYMDEWKAERTGKEAWNLPITDQMKEEISTKGLPLYQGDQEQRKGVFVFGEDGTSLIAGFESADTSTGVHELGHAARRFLFADDADPAIAVNIDDRQIAEGHYGVVNSSWTTEQEEAFADDFTAWVHGGKVESPGLVNIFQKLGTWLSQIYGKVTKDVSPEMQGVFNRMIASNYDIMGGVAGDIKQSLSQDSMEHITVAATRDYDEMINDFRLNDLNLTDDENEIGMAYLAQRQGVDTERDPVSIDDLNPELLARIQEWDKNLKAINEKILKRSTELGIEYSPLEMYFPLRHRQDSHTGEEDPTDILMEAGRNITAHRGGTYGGVIKNPKEQLQIYLQDVATFLAQSEATIQGRESVEANLPEIAVAKMKQDAGEALNDAEKAAIQMLEELKTLEEAGYNQPIRIPKSILGDETFLNAVAKGEEVGMRSGIEIGFMHASMMNTIDPGFVAVWMDGVSYDSIKKTGVFAGGNYSMRRSILDATALYKRKSQFAIDTVSSTVKEHIKGGKALTSFEKKMALIWKDNDERKVLLRGGRNASAKEYGTLGLTPSEARVALVMVTQLQLAGLTMSSGSHAIQSTLAESKEKLRKEWTLLHTRKKNKTITKEQQKRLDFLEKKHGNTLKNRIINAVFEHQSLENGSFFGMYEAMIDRSYKDSIIGTESAKVEAWEKVLRSKGLDEYANWWQNVRLRNLEGKLFDFENNIINSVSEKTVSLNNKIRAVFGIDATEETTEDVKRKVLIAANDLHRARINAWLAGNLAWSVVTQPGSLAMTIKQTDYKAFFSATKTMVSHDVNVVARTVKLMRDGVPTREAFKKANYTERQKLGESTVREIKGTGRDVSGKAVEVSEWDEKKIRTSIRHKIREGVGRLASNVEERTVDISVLAGKHFAERLGLSGKEAEIYADFIAETTQSMYDQYTRNMMISSPGLRALAPMQSFVYTAYSNVWDLANNAGIDKSAKQRGIELIQWKTAAILWDAMWSMLMGDDPLKALFNGGMEKDTLTSHIPVLPSASHYIGIDIDQIYIDKWNALMPEKFERADMDWKKDPIASFANRTAGAFGPSTVNRRSKHALLWANDYIIPHAGLPTTKLTHNFIEMVYAELDHGSIRSNTGHLTRYIPGIDETTPLEDVANFITGTVFGAKAVDEKESLLDN